MAPGDLEEFEQMVLLAVLHLSEHAFGVPIGLDLERRTGRRITAGELYATLDRLEATGFVHSWFADPVPPRGGRAKRYFKLQPKAVKALAESKNALDMGTLWRGTGLKTLASFGNRLSADLS